MDKNKFNGVAVTAIEAGATVATYGHASRLEAETVTQMVMILVGQEMQDLLRCDTLLHRYPDGKITMEFCSRNGDGLILEWAGEKWEMTRLFTTDLDIDRSENDTPAFMRDHPVELD